MGASTSGFAADIFMEHIETKALATFAEPPRLWKRFVDDTYAIIKTQNLVPFLQHLNDQHEDINFTTENAAENQLPFLDVLTKIEADRSISTSVYRKPTHTSQYLDWTSNHHIKQKMGIISTFRHRINKIVTKPEDKQQEEKIVKEALTRCNHPAWTLKPRPKSTNPTKDRPKPNGTVTIPYIPKLSENIGKLLKKHNIQAVHKPSITIKNLLCTKIKDPTHDLDKTGVIYQTKCCNDQKTYVGETGRSLKARAYEHGIITREQSTKNHSFSAKQDPGPPELEQPPQNVRRSQRNRTTHNYKSLATGSDQALSLGTTEVSAHIAESNHTRSHVTISIIDREPNFRKRGIKEAIHISKIRPNLNKPNDPGKYRLPHIYNQIRPQISTPRTLNATQQDQMSIPPTLAPLEEVSVLSTPSPLRTDEDC